MKINRRLLLGGAGGFVGSSLTQFFSGRGWEVVPLSRKREPGKIFWDIENGILSPEDLSGFDVAISLAGENIFSRWNKDKKEKILSSRVKSAGMIAHAISRAENPPKVFICASAVGYYGTKHSEPRSEKSPAGEGFLAQVCSEWEKASQSADTPDTRIVNARFGIVIDHSGGMLGVYDRFLRFKIAPILGSGKQKMSWISLRDLCRAMETCIENPNLSGAVNFSSPEACTNSEFARACAKSRGGFSVCVPAPALKIIMGEAAEALALSDITALPQKLCDSGFQFADRDIKSAIAEK